MASIADLMVANFFYWRRISVIFKYNTVAQEPRGQGVHDPLLSNVITCGFLHFYYHCILCSLPPPLLVFVGSLPSPLLTMFIRRSNIAKQILMYLLILRAFKCTILVSGNLHLGMRKKFTPSILHLIPSNFRRYQIKLDVVLNVTLE